MVLSTLVKGLDRGELLKYDLVMDLTYSFPNEVEKIPSLAGVYAIEFDKHKSVYVGQSSDINYRAKQHKYSGKFSTYGDGLIKLLPLPLDSSERREQEKAQVRHYVALGWESLSYEHSTAISAGKHDRLQAIEKTEFEATGLSNLLTDLAKDDKFVFIRNLKQASSLMDKLRVSSKNMGLSTLEQETLNFVSKSIFQIYIDYTSSMAKNYKIPRRDYDRLFSDVTIESIVDNLEFYLQQELDEVA